MIPSMFPYDCGGKGHPIGCPSNIPYYCNAMPHPVNGSPSRY